MESEQPITLEERKATCKPLVLVVDDEPGHLRLMEMLADRLDITAHTAQSCKEAIEALRMLSFDVILMDCRMPEVDGYICTRLIREMTEKSKNTPIIAVTADGLPGHREKCLQAGMHDFLLKPFTIEELHEKLCYWLRRRED